MLGRFNEDLSALHAGDPLGRRRDAVRALFTRTRAIRRGIVEVGQDSPARISAARTPRSRTPKFHGPTRPRTDDPRPVGFAEYLIWSAPARSKSSLRPAEGSAPRVERFAAIPGHTSGRQATRRQTSPARRRP